MTIFNLISVNDLIRLVGAYSANHACRTEPRFFGLVPWYHYLNVAADSKGQCYIKDFKFLGNGIDSGIPLILLAIVDDLLRIAGMVAVGFVIYGAIQYITSQGEPEKTAKAQGTILNALIGLAIALVAVTVVSFLGAKIGANKI